MILLEACCETIPVVRPAPSTGILLARRLFVVMRRCPISTAALLLEMFNALRPAEH